MTHPRSYYELLGVSHSADVTTLRRAFCTLSKALHPDTTALPAEEAARKFQQVCEAYELLSDPLRREAYDEILDVENSTLIAHGDQYANLSKEVFKNARSQEVRRSFSGGELFSLLSLGIALLFSLLLAIGFAFTQGREWQSRPSWLIAGQNPGTVIAKHNFDVSVTSIPNAFESTFFSST